MGQPQWVFLSAGPGQREFQFAKPFVRQTWNKGFDDKGRPDIIPGNDPTPEGNDKIQPGVDGGANWMAHSYSPITKLMYVFARDERRMFTKNAIRHGNRRRNRSAALAPSALR